MTQEEKQRLLVDISARLTYGVKVHCEWFLFQGDRVSEDGELVSINIYSKSIHFKRNSGRITEIPFNRIDGKVLPYLRPMSSMTEEEIDELKKLSSGVVWRKDVLRDIVLDIWYNTDSIDWLNKKGFDYRGLITMGLALPATEDMYK